MKTRLKVVGAIFAYSSSFASAGIFDSFKDQSDLVQNQKKCVYFNQVQGEMVDGKFLYGNTRVLAEFKKLGKDRLSFKRLVNIEEGETAPTLVLSLSKKNNQISAALPNGTIVLSCTL